MQIDLAAGQTAIVVKLRVTLDSDRPVNVCVTRFENGELDLALNGDGKTALLAENAVLLCFRDAPAAISVGDSRISLDLHGPVVLQHGSRPHE